MKTQYPTHGALTRLLLQLLAGPTYPDTYGTRSVADSTAADGITIVVDTAWDGERHYTFDDNDSVHLVIPDSVPTGDAGNAA